MLTPLLSIVIYWIATRFFHRLGRNRDIRKPVPRVLNLPANNQTDAARNAWAQLKIDLSNNEFGKNLNTSA